MEDVYVMEPRGASGFMYGKCGKINGVGMCAGSGMPGSRFYFLSWRRSRYLEKVIFIEFAGVVGYTMFGKKFFSVGAGDVRI